METMGIQTEVGQASRGKLGGPVRHQSRLEVKPNLGSNDAVPTFSDNATHWGMSVTLLNGPQIAIGDACVAVSAMGIFKAISGAIASRIGAVNF